MTTRPEVVATEVRFGEGPVWCAAADGRPASLVFTAVAAGAVDRVDLASGAVTRVADVGGGANAALLTSDGGFLVTQNGGIDFTRTGLYADPPPYRPATPGIQRVAPDGTVGSVVTTSTDDGPFLAPNDLVAAADGTLWFTDPPVHPPPPERVGRVHTMAPDGTTRVVARDFHYCNGIALEPDGTPVVIEAAGLLRLDPHGDRAWVTEQISPTGNTGDGLCVDVDGRFYVAATADHGIRVLEPDGTEVDFLEIPGRGVTTNCCFGGDDLRTLFATDGVPGQVLAWEGMPTAGLALHPWPAPADAG
ncbi:MAG: SMP-30/gluconolactonase/LRE family protein [Acidimicrobiia bacterium]